jgi:uncharacterized protein YcnI
MLTVPARIITRLPPFGILVAVLTAVVCSGATRAGADVAIQPPAVAPADLVTFTVQVVNDRAPAATTRVELDFPKRPAIAYLDAIPVPGWSMRVVKYRLAHIVDTPDGTSGVAISRVVWTGGPLAGANLVRFTLRIGPVPASSNRLLFTARQTYDTGATVTYADNPDLATAARPKLVLAVSRFAASRAPGTAVAPDAPFSLSEKQAIDRRVRTLIRNGEIATPDDLESARWIALAALVIASVGLALAFAAWTRTRRTSGSPPGEPGAADARPEAEVTSSPSGS